jgi:hypothetical protein
MGGTVASLDSAATVPSKFSKSIRRGLSHAVTLRSRWAAPYPTTILCVSLQNMPLGVKPEKGRSFVRAVRHEAP